MELQYVEVENWDKLGNHDIIYFKLPKKQIEYQVIIAGNSVFCDNNKIFNNSAIFDYLNLDATDFAQNIVKYPCTGIWPEVKSIDDLKKVIKALDDECVKKFGNPNTPKFKVGDKVRILPRVNNKYDYRGIYIDDMLHFSGKVATIEEIYADSTIKLDSNGWIWDTKALELVDEKEESKTIDIHQIKIDKPETQFEAELNLFPTKKHYQLNFNY